MSLRLVQTVTYRMEGVFFRAGLQCRRPVPFQGLIRVGEMGGFGGVMIDQHGGSEIDGYLIANIARDSIRFTKMYDPTHQLYRDGADRPIQYELFFSISGGWDGEWHIDNADPADHGYVTMGIVPWKEGKGYKGQDGFPINPDLLDYFFRVAHKF